MDNLQRAREDFYKIMQRQNILWDLIDNKIVEDEDEPVKPLKPLKEKKKKVKAKIELELNESNVH